MAISEGRFIPDVTNSWANSRAILNLNGKEKKYRSTWEAFFQLVNPELEESDLEKAGEHSDSGPYKIAQWIKTYTNHPQDHGDQLIRATKEQN